MADLFDLANLITTVGVDGVKIKPEPGLPEKSSNEILDELFNTFDVDEESDDAISSDQEENQSETNDKINAKKKKLKRKHKHKDKKYKHKSRKNSSESEIETENVPKKKKKKKKTKRKHEDSDENNCSKKAKIKKSINDCSDIIENDQPSTNIKVEGDRHEKETSLDKNKEEKEFFCLTQNKNAVEPVLPCFYEKQKTSVNCKIQIKNLKNSEVFNKVVEEVEKKKEKERMEDGEISDTDDERRDTSLALNPSNESCLEIQDYSTEKFDKNRDSYSDRYSKADLRLLINEKEKHRSASKVEQKYKRNRDNDNIQSRKSLSRDGKSEFDSRRTRSRHRNRDSNRFSKTSRFQSENRNKYSRSRSSDRKERIEIDKKKLLEIARRNAINMIKKGKLPLAQQDKAIAAIQAGGKSIDELTDFCKSLSKSEAMGELSSISSDDNSESEKGFHHPFMVKDRPSSIIMNIRDSKQLPTKTFLEKTTESPNQLRLQFPVSSGQQHRKTENEWVPVIKPKPEPKKKFIAAKELFHTIPQTLITPPLQQQNIPLEQPISDGTVNSTSTAEVPIEQYSTVQNPHLPMMVHPSYTNVPCDNPLAISSTENVFTSNPPSDNVFPSESIDISTIVSQRLSAMRKLSENPNDIEALQEMYQAQSGMKTWVESKQIPGQFTGSTGARVLTPAELTSGYQAWAKKDQLLTAQPVAGGMGMALLQKMGWRPGEGLGKNKEGTLEPLQLEVKLDKKGLVSDQDIGAERFRKPSKGCPNMSTRSIEGKHPVSLLGEYCSKHKIGAPQYELCFECGPDHKKNFLFKVRVNGIEYQPTIASPNKKLAKSEAAQICLQNLGILPNSSVSVNR